jgi:acyl-coenzyme A synthetase/AMP-(fatty) acid ligase
MDSIAQLREYFVDLVDVSRTIVDQSHENLAEAVVVQRQDDKQQLQAFIVMSANGDSTTLPYLQVLLRSLRLPAYLRSTRAVALTALPLTRDGKADRSTLQTIEVDTTRSIEVVQPASSYK